MASSVNAKKWVKGWFITISAVPLIGAFNYCVDPRGYNNLFLTEFNAEKIIIDERQAKFNLIRNGDFKTFVFGSSRNTIIDPGTIKKYIDGKAINAAFSASEINEIYDFFKWTIDHKSVNVIFIGVDLFMFDSDFHSNGTMPDELKAISSTEKVIFLLSKYLSFQIFLESFRVIYQNLTADNDEEGIKKSYLKKGMRYYSTYLSLTDQKSIEEYAQKNVTSHKAHWHGGRDYSRYKKAFLHKIISLAKLHNIELHLFTNPITIQQIFCGDNYLIQLDLIKNIVKDNPGTTLHDFNNFNKVNFNNNYFIDIVHFNYDVADCIVDKILTGTSACGLEFGHKVNSNNISDYVKTISSKYDALNKKYRVPSEAGSTSCKTPVRDKIKDIQ